MAEKTEKATPKKLRDGRKKGQVAKSQDFPSAFTFVTSISATLMSTGYLFKQIGGFIMKLFHSVGTGVNIENMAGAYLFQAMEVIAYSSFPIVLITALVGVLVNFLIIGPLFSFEAMKFDFKKLDPIAGLKQKFKLKTIMELTKNILKLIGAAAIIYFTIVQTIPEAIQTVAMPVYGSALILDEFLIKITIRVAVFFLMVAVFDLSFQKYDFGKSMKMEKFEVKQEFKDTEGDPMIKGKRRETFREIAYQEGPGAAKKARTIITNPTHIAVAISYDEEADPAPFILTMGQGIIADQIVKVAISNHIPIMRNVSLAQDLFARGSISGYIPEDTYETVAEILKWISSLEENPDVNAELLR